MASSPVYWARSTTIWGVMAISTSATPTGIRTPIGAAKCGANRRASSTSWRSTSIPSPPPRARYGWCRVANTMAMNMPRHYKQPCGWRRTSWASPVAKSRPSPWKAIPATWWSLTRTPNIAPGAAITGAACSPSTALPATAKKRCPFCATKSAPLPASGSIRSMAKPCCATPAHNGWSTCNNPSPNKVI